MSRIYHRGARRATFRQDRRRRRLDPGPGERLALKDVMGRCGAGIRKRPGAGGRYAPVAEPLSAGEAVAFPFEADCAAPLGTFL